MDFYIGSSSQSVSSVIFPLPHPFECNFSSSQLVSSVFFSGFVCGAVWLYVQSIVVILIGPLVAGVGSSLAMPMSAIVDSVIRKTHSFSSVFLVGGFCLMCAVVLVTVDSERSEKLKKNKAEKLLEEAAMSNTTESSSKEVFKSNTTESSDKEVVKPNTTESSDIETAKLNTTESFTPVDETFSSCETAFSRTESQFVVVNGSQ